MKNYREQPACHSCKHVFEMHEYDSGDGYYCTLGAPPRPLCGSVAMGESFSRTIPYNLADSEANVEAWQAWSKDRIVEAWGICDGFEQAQEAEATLEGANDG